MKKTMPFFAALLMIIGLALSVTSCKKVDLAELEYKGMHKKDYLESYVNKKGGEMVLWFQVLDRAGNEGIINSYKAEKARVGKYPAKIYKNKSVWILVNKRIEVRVTADDTNDDFQDTEKLEKFVNTFDLAGMAEVEGDKLKAEDLEKFIPALGGK